MPLQYSVAVRNARLDVVESTIGATAVLRIRTGAQPATCATADSGTVLATLTLPSDWLAAASGGTKALSGTWQDTSADATGTAAHYRIYDSSGATCHEQGECTLAGGGGQMILDSLSFTAGQSFTVVSYDKTAGNA
jgi:hypothetical protein